MARTMQYLVSLSDETAEKLLELERLWGETRDKVVAQAIVLAYISDASVHEKDLEEYGHRKFGHAEAVLSKTSSIAMAILQQSLEEGRSIRIPSLGITIEPERKE